MHLAQPDFYSSTFYFVAINQTLARPTLLLIRLTCHDGSLFQNKFSYFYWPPIPSALEMTGSTCLFFSFTWNDRCCYKKQDTVLESSHNLYLEGQQYLAILLHPFVFPPQKLYVFYWLWISDFLYFQFLLSNIISLPISLRKQKDRKVKAMATKFWLPHIHPIQWMQHSSISALVSFLSPQ